MLKAQLDAVIDRHRCSAATLASKRALALAVRLGDAGEIVALLGLARLQQEALDDTLRNRRAELSQRVQDQDAGVPATG